MACINDKNGKKKQRKNKKDCVQKDELGEGIYVLHILALRKAKRKKDKKRPTLGKWKEDGK